MRESPLDMGIAATVSLHRQKEKFLTTQFQMIKTKRKEEFLTIHLQTKKRKVMKN